jgi:hypothetical protein
VWLWAVSCVLTWQSGEIQGDERVGLFLQETVSVIPKVHLAHVCSSHAVQIDVEEFETVFNSTLQDLLMVAFLADLAKSQVPPLTSPCASDISDCAAGEAWSCPALVRVVENVCPLSIISLLVGVHPQRA